MDSFFNRLYKYKQSDLKNQKENFLTEIFAYCLNNDLIFRKKFLKLISCNFIVKEFYCETQSFSKDFGRPDILIEINEDIIIVIECKVGSSQEQSQLQRYSNFLLQQKGEKKFLIYLTKTFEETESFDPLINFFKIRWFNISDLLSDCKNEISKELFQYLKEEKMSNKITFNRTEISAITNIQETLAKMDEFNLLLKDRLNEYVKSKITASKKIEAGYYGITTQLHSGNLWLGFYQDADREEVQIMISIELPLSDPNFKLIDSKLLELNWNSYPQSNVLQVWFNSANFSKFLINDVFSTHNALDFLEENLRNIKIF
jgi:hypothetical protein